MVGGDSATAAIMFAGIGSLGIAGLQPGTSQWLAFASLSALLAAGLLVLARVARLGFLANFISRTVLVGFLTGVGIQVAMGQFAGLFGVPAPSVALDRAAGTLVKFWDTLTELGQTSGATLTVSLSVLAILVVFGRWIRLIPGGLVAVVGLIAVSWIFDLSAHGVSTLGPVPSGLPHIGFPQGVTWQNAAGLLATAASLFLVILAQSAATSRAYAVKYRERGVVGLGLVGAADGRAIEPFARVCDRAGWRARRGAARRGGRGSGVGTRRARRASRRSPNSVCICRIAASRDSPPRMRSAVRMSM